MRFKYACEECSEYTALIGGVFQRTFEAGHKNYCSKYQNGDGDKNDI